MNANFNIPFGGYGELRYNPQMPGLANTNPGMNPIFAGQMQTQPSFTGASNYTMQSKREFGNIDYNHIMLSQSIQGLGAFLRHNNQSRDFKNYNRVQSNPLLQIPNNPNTSQQSEYGMNQFKKGGLKKKDDGGFANFDDFNEEDFQDLKDEMDHYFSEKGQKTPEADKVDIEDKDQVADKQDETQDQPMSHEAINFLNSQQPEQSQDNENDNDQDDVSNQSIEAPPLSLHSAPIANDGLLQAFKNGIAKVENANYNEGNKNSTAFGKYQFTAPTLEAVREQHFKNISKKDFIDTYKSDPQFQEKVMDAYGSHLLSKYSDPHQAATAFFLGEGKANYYNQPTYRPTSNNLTVGKYLQNFDQGYGKRQGGHVMNKPQGMMLPFNPQMKMEEGGEGPGKPKQANQATPADSLAIYNNALQVAKYYKSNQDYKDQGKVFSNHGFLGTEDVNQSSYQDIVDHYNKGQMTQTQVGKKLVKPEEYRKNIDSNRYYQREDANSILDLNAPMTLFDKRISPQYSSDYYNTSSGELSGDRIELYEYDPIGVKPWNMLTDSERKERVQKYGYPRKNIESLGDNPNNWRTVVPGLKVNYQPVPPIAKKSQVQGPQSINQSIPNIQGSPLIPGQGIQPSPTQFSFTGTENGQQSTRYFQDLDTWKAATEAMGYRHRETTNQGKEAHATGYEFKEGGEYELTDLQIKQLKKMGYKIDIL